MSRRAFDGPRGGSGTVLMVCTGNMCRSPVAEALLRMRLGDDSGISVRSAGTLAEEGTEICSTMAHLLAERGVSASGFSSRRLTATMLESADLILGMDQSHVRESVAIAPAAMRRTATLREFAAWIDRLDLRSSTAGRGDRLPDLVQAAVRRRGTSFSAGGPDEADIADPVGLDAAFHRHCFNTIDEAVGRLAAGLAWYSGA